MINTEILVTILSLFLATVCTAVAAAWFLFNQNEIIKHYLTDRIDQLEDLLAKEYYNRKSRFLIMKGEIVLINKRLKNIESSLDRLILWAYQKGYIPKKTDKDILEHSQSDSYLLNLEPDSDLDFETDFQSEFKNKPKKNN